MPYFVQNNVIHKTKTTTTTTITTPV